MLSTHNKLTEYNNNNITNVSLAEINIERRVPVWEGWEVVGRVREKCWKEWRREKGCYEGSKKWVKCRLSMSNVEAFVALINFVCWGYQFIWSLFSLLAFLRAIRLFAHQNLSLSPPPTLRRMSEKCNQGWLAIKWSSNCLDNRRKSRFVNFSVCLHSLYLYK